MLMIIMYNEAGFIYHLILPHLTSHFARMIYLVQLHYICVFTLSDRTTGAFPGGDVDHILKLIVRHLPFLFLFLFLFFSCRRLL
eukprot:m.12119 g.12119  ORF g.12119 m.12119 type:complete len:84 (+) comp6763_c0_seq1:190-441(+)